jgi:hypothetical protein
MIQSAMSELCESGPSNVIDDDETITISPPQAHAMLATRQREFSPVRRKLRTIWVLTHSVRMEVGESIPHRVHIRSVGVRFDVMESGASSSSGAK